jgi:hypothetical protein
MILQWDEGITLLTKDHPWTLVIKEIDGNIEEEEPEYRFNLVLQTLMGDHVIAYEESDNGKDIEPMNAILRELSAGIKSAFMLNTHEYDVVERQSELRRRLGMNE